MGGPAASARRRALLVAGAVLCLAAPLGAGGAEVTPERLAAAAEEPQNWLMPLGDHAGRRYSGLSAIDKGNVARLVVRYSVPLGDIIEGSGNFTATVPTSPLVDDGFIYIVDGWGRVLKLDARRRGAVVWASEAGQHNLDAWLEASRGIALHRDSVLATAADGRLHIIDAATGEVRRSVQVGDPREGYTIVAPPLVVGDRAIVGGGGADRGARGQIDALDAGTGEPLWRTYAVPAPDEPGGHTWSGDAWRMGGGTFAQPGAYDPSTGLTIWGTGAPFPPLQPQLRPGDNLHTNSALALDVATGRIAWHFQYVPGDPNGFSENGVHQLVRAGDATFVTHFGNDGYFYTLRASDGGFVAATAHAPGIEWTAGLDPAGRPLEYAAAPVQSYRTSGDWAGTADCPNILGVPGFLPAHSPRTGLSYGAGADACLPEERPAPRPSATGWLGAYHAGAVGGMGLMSAVDPVSARIVAQRMFDAPLHAGALATAGGLVFTTTADGTLHALDDATLEPLATFPLGSLTSVAPVSFAVDGEQFVAVVVGGNPLVSALRERPRELSGSEHLFVLVVLGLRR